MFDDFASFLISYKKTKGKEGFYTSGTGATADDPGKETVYGLTRLGEPDSPVWAIVERFRRLPGFPENMRRDPELLKAVQETYYDKYWRPMGCHRLSSQVLKNKLFDAAVNIGVPVLSIMLQYALNCFNKKQTLWADIAVDGHIGGATTTAVEAMLGLPEEPALRRMFIDAVKAADPEQGVSARAMAKRYPILDAIGWMEYCATWHSKGYVRQWWGLCRDGGGATLQESRYGLPNGEL